ncbi:MAG TPA: GNAT family N-acetyltransferase [Luteimonas sp.]|nr:GNAT family N-acetyltransferase [Luteimonas sp.]
MDGQDAPPLRFRAWREDDRDTGLALFDSNVPQYFAAQERADFIEFIDDLPGPYFVALDADGIAVGCGGYAVHDKKPETAALCWGMIDRAHHGRGWGDALLRHRLDLIAREPVFRWVEIETSQFSRGFFERYGFVQRRTVADGFAPGIDLIDMTLDMDQYRNVRHP